MANFTLQELGPRAAICAEKFAETDADFQKTVLFSPGIWLAGDTDV